MGAKKLGNAPPRKSTRPFGLFFAPEDKGRNMDIRNFKDSTKAAAAYLAAHNLDVPHTRLLEAIAHGFGERNWSTLSAQLQALKAPKAPKAPKADIAVASPTETVPEWDVSQGPMTEAQYLAKKGNCCPFCGSREIEADSIEADGPDAWDNCKCNDCNATWSSAYTLTGFFDEKEGTAPQAPAACIILVQNGSMTTNLEGLMYDLAKARPVLVELLDTEPDCSDESLLGQLQNDVECIEALKRHGVPHCGRAVRATLWEVRNVLEQEAREMKRAVQVGRREVIESLVEDVQDRARKYSFSVHGWARALECVADTNDVLDLDATPTELFAAASQLA
jgi:hypothetical protein